MSATTAVTYDMTAIDNRAPNVGRQFFDRVRATPNREAYRYPKGDTWESQTWQETGDHVTKLAAGLVALGIEPEQRVGIAAGHPVRVDPRGPRDHVRRRRDHDGLPLDDGRRRRLHPRPTPSAGWCSPRTTARSPSCSSARPSCRTCPR